MNLNQLRYFKSIVETGSFQQAANILKVSQPSVSNAIIKLEAELNTQLFDRTNRDLQVTPQGMDFYYYVNESLATLGSGAKQIHVHSTKNTKLNLGFFFSIGSQFIPQMISEYWKQYPDDQFKFIQKSSYNLQNALINRDCDAVICSLPAKQNPHNIYTPILRQNFVVAVSTQHRLARRHRISLDELDGETLLTFPLQSIARQYINNLLIAEHISPKQTIDFEEDRTILGFVAKNIGYAILPKTEVTTFPGIKALTLSEIIPFQNIYLGYPNETDHNPGLRRLVEFTKQYCQKHYDEFN